MIEDRNDGSGESTKSDRLLTGGKILIVRAESVTIVRERRRSEEQCRSKLDAASRSSRNCVRILALLLQISRTSIARIHAPMAATKNESDRRSRREKKGADKTLGPHIVGLKSYLIGKQFKINKARECEVAL